MVERISGSVDGTKFFGEEDGLVDVGKVDVVSGAVSKIFDATGMTNAEAVEVVAIMASCALSAAKAEDRLLIMGKLTEHVVGCAQYVADEMKKEMS